MTNQIIRIGVPIASGTNFYPTVYQGDLKKHFLGYLRSENR